MDDLVSVHDLLNQGTSLSIVHRPDFLDTLVIGLLELLKALLQLDELVSEELVLLRVLNVQVVGISLLNIKEVTLLSQLLSVALLLELEALLLLVEDRLALVQHIEVETKLLLVEFVHGLHVLHALLEDLHLGLELDLLLSLLVGVLTHHKLEISSVLGLLLLSLRQVVRLNGAVVFEEVLDFVFVSVEDGRTLSVELRLDALELLVVVLSHLNKLLLHLGDELVDILRHLLNRFDVVAIFLIDLGLKLLDELHLVCDDLSASCLLRLNVLSKGRRAGLDSN